MNDKTIKELATKWLIEHEHYQHEPMFNDDLKSLCNLIKNILDEQELMNSYSFYDNDYE